ncbi:MAG: sulfotransferase family 2 domain-containing protein [Gammaproteobacteria bacterium]|nr:sulfotransferase family 2 domain-containing protein [Gammaproteobacteria bacterium]
MAVIPNLFIVGAPKCGTTSMDNYLNQHPDIYMSEEKELHYFGSDIKRYPEFVCSTERYEAAFSNWRNEKRIGESSTLYLMSRLAAKEIKAYSPDARIIIILRDPIDMLLSYHVHLYYSHIQNISDFREALAEGEKRRFMQNGNEADIDPDKITNTMDLRVYRDAVKYTVQVERYFNVFGRENVHVILFDDFKKDIAAVYRDTLKFLGVDDRFEPDFRFLNSSRMVGTKGIWRPPLIARALARKVFSQQQREWLVELIFHKLLGKVDSKKPKELIDNKLRAELRAEFAPEIERLGILLNRDLSHWNAG